MRLTAFLREIEASKGPITGLELAQRLGIPPAEVMGMVHALRAAGKLTPDGPLVEDHCATAASCSLSCPGPDHCSLSVSVTVPGLQIRSSTDRRDQE